MSRGEKRTIRGPPYSHEQKSLWVFSLPSVQVSPIQAHENFRTYTKHTSPPKKKKRNTHTTLATVILSLTFSIVDRSFDLSFTNGLVKLVKTDTRLSRRSKRSAENCMKQWAGRGEVRSFCTGGFAIYFTQKKKKRERERKYKKKKKKKKEPKWCANRHELYSTLDRYIGAC